MTRAISYGLGLGMLSLALGCGGSAAVKEMESIANKVCECKDMECIQKVQKEQEEWVAKNGDAFAGSEADAEKMSAATQKMTDCVTKVVEAEAAKAGGE